ncbi:hypothetical protein F4777DRAFT_599404 [Nemania sp. FL0916]|nr:hypothetical protein F4777DRAFT_599404 [Nemania sp. FL0916]
MNIKTQQRHNLTNHIKENGVPAAVSCHRCNSKGKECLWAPESKSDRCSECVYQGKSKCDVKVKNRELDSPTDQETREDSRQIQSSHRVLNGAESWPNQVDVQWEYTMDIGLFQSNKYNTVVSDTEANNLIANDFHSADNANYHGNTVYNDTQISFGEYARVDSTLVPTSSDNWLEGFNGYPYSTSRQVQMNQAQVALLRDNTQLAIDQEKHTAAHFQVEDEEYRVGLQ